MIAARLRSFGVALALIGFAVSLTAALVNLLDVAAEARNRLHENSIWAATQLVQELLRLENAVQQPASDAAIRERLDVAWSRLGILQAGEIGQLMSEDPELAAARERLVQGFEALDTALGPDATIDHAAALGTLTTLNAEAWSTSVGLMHREEARLQAYADHEYTAIVVLTVSFVGLMASGAAMTVFLLLASRRARSAAARAAATEGLLRDAIEAVSDGFVLFDRDDRLVLCNERYRNVYRETGQTVEVGSTFEEIVRAGISRGQYPAAEGREEAWVAERLAQHRNPQGSIEQALPNGRWVRIEERKTRDGGTVGIRVDISELKQRERELAELEALRRAVLEMAMDAVVTIDEAGSIIEYNAAAERIFGFDRSAVLGRTLAETIIPHQYRAAHRQGMKRYLATGENNVLNRRIEVTALRQDGSEVPVELAVTQVEANGKRYFTAFMRDIGRRQAAERALRESEANLAVAQKIARLGSWSWQPYQGKLFWSKQVSEILGLGPDAPLDRRRYLARVVPEDRPLLRRAIGRAMRRRNGRESSSFTIRHRIVRTDGAVRHLLGQGRVDFSADGDPVQVSGTVQDVTELRQVEEALVRARDEAEAANEAKSDFLATMSHEIRTPLNGVLGTLSLLAGMNLDPECQRYVDLARQSGSALLDLLNDILDVSSIEAGRITLEPRPFNVATLLDSVLGIWRPQITAKAITLRHEIGAGVPPVLLGDAGRLRQMLMNYVNNAFKFTDTGEIRCTVAPSPEQPGWLRFRVDDTGIGIPAESHGRVFKAFERVRSGPRQRGTGSGLGLAITRRLAELMGGTVGFASSPGDGSSFWFDVPLPASAATPAANASEDDTGQLVCADGNAPRILVAEDNRTNQIVVRAMLVRLGCTVDVVANGLEAVDAVQSRPYHCVLMDISMPVLDGIGATMRIRGLDAPCSRIPILATTAYASAEDAANFAASGFDGTVTKPLSPKSLRTALAPLVAGTVAGTGAPEDERAAPAGPLDRAVLDTLRDELGEATFTAALDQAMKDLERELDALAKGSEQGEGEKVARASHVLKGIAPMFGALDFAARVATVHELANDGDLRGAVAAAKVAMPAGRSALGALNRYRASADRPS